MRINKTITKTDFLAYIDSPRHFWALKHNQYEKILDDFDKHLIQQGYIVEEKAKEYTRKYLLPKYSTNPNDLVLQNTCTKGQFETKTDILLRNERTGKWDIYEVKSVTKPKKEHYYDITFQKIVCDEQLDIADTYILHVNGDYVKQGVFDLGQFLIAENTNEKVKTLREEVEKMMQSCTALVELNNYKLATACRKPKECPCIDLCHPNLPEQSIYDLSRVTEKKILALRDDDILDIVDIPDDFDLTPNQRIQTQVAKLNRAYVDKRAIAKELDTLEYPLYFLDYETFNPVIPIYDGYKPYQQMVFQYSLHVLESPDDDNLKHYEYIVKDPVETSGELLTSLNQHIGATGSILVWYKSFEGTRNKEMAELNPDFAEFLESVNTRIYDLMDIFKKNYYVDPRFKGSNSIKDVLPMLVPELNYKDLEIQNGTLAMIGWYKMVYGNAKENEKTVMLDNLLKYCEQDTLAMVKIWKFLKKL
jgi:hypothetical protein